MVKILNKGNISISVYNLFVDRQGKISIHRYLRLREIEIQIVEKIPLSDWTKNR